MNPMRFPLSRGFSFCCWARVEAYPTSQSEGPYDGAMGLFRFATEQGKGYTVILQDYRIVVQVRLPACLPARLPSF